MKRWNLWSAEVIYRGGTHSLRSLDGHGILPSMQQVHWELDFCHRIDYSGRHFDRLSKWSTEEQIS